MNLHFLIIVLHAISSVIAFITGWVTLAQLNKRPAPALLGLYLSGMVGMVIFMLGVPTWGVIVISVLGIAAGIFGVNQTKSKWQPNFSNKEK